MARARSPFDSARELWGRDSASGWGCSAQLLAQAGLPPGARSAPAQPCLLSTAGATTEWCKRREMHLRGRGLGLTLWQRRGAAGGGGGKGKGEHCQHQEPPRNATHFTHGCWGVHSRVVPGEGRPFPTRLPQPPPTRVLLTGGCSHPSPCPSSPAGSPEAWTGTPSPGKKGTGSRGSPKPSTICSQVHPDPLSQPKLCLPAMASMSTPGARIQISALIGLTTKLPKTSFSFQTRMVPHTHPWAPCHGLLCHPWRGAGPGPPVPPRVPAAPRHC